MQKYTDHSGDGERSDAHENDAVESSETAESTDRGRNSQISASQVARRENSEYEVERSEPERTGGGRQDRISRRTRERGASHGDGGYGETAELEVQWNPHAMDIDDGDEHRPRCGYRESEKGRTVDMHATSVEPE